MNRPDEARLAAAIAATWPPAAVDDETVPGWRLRDGAGGGKRVSSALSLGGRDFEAVAAAMRAKGERPLIQIMGGDADLDAALEAAGWELVDPVVVYIGDAAQLAETPLAKGVKHAEVRTRLVLLDEVWDAGGIGPARRAVMARCERPNTVVMARTDMVVAGACFVAVDGEVAMLHAAEVRREFRRQGAGRALMAGAARFALDNGAPWLALVVTEANAPARALYETSGMTEAARYRYRQAPQEGDTP